ncbi:MULTISPECIES: mandelate racemase/muconate lactonizing enzyme family protein [unclassified Achromobacter]|uniref:mandelate racemase/muconate lactonizing enzyme family protein n=1 Tax=unclassified Achromobacter TaxID=2626865 RepID=UPI000B517C3C|nr:MULTISPECIES: mandelate racemase/muconate lactonizing enzyme family protein [unclassified Achromobacter]OWT80279.1 dehydratase [Achromobacter sp. HZ34]OWT82162.1 dehydratase [Achromobacter sp. HZ28]
MSIITALRTYRLPDRPSLIWLEIDTDEGLTGLGETFRGAAAVETVIHTEIAPQLLGRDASAIEGINSLLTLPYVGYNASGAEVRAASAVDIALWDLAGQRQRVPLYQALGGAARPTIPVYNTCAGYAYNSTGKRRDIGGNDVAAGPYDDQVAFMRDAGALAVSLRDEGYGAMKIWPFDIYAPKTQGQVISLPDLKRGLEPFKRVREAVGDDIEVMCEMHGLWGNHAALRICQALEDYGVFWAEDPISKMDDVHTLADLRSRTRTPICGSESLAGLPVFRDLLAADALDVVMLDLCWCGGLTTARKIAALAQAYAKPLAPHDCTGPVALMAGLHLALHASTAIYQEVVRATLATWYRDLVTDLPDIQAGIAQPPRGHGLGTRLTDAFKARTDLTVRLSNLN